MLKRNRKAAAMLAVVAMVFAALVMPAASTAKATVSMKFTVALKVVGSSSKGQSIAGKGRGTIGKKSYSGVKITSLVAPPKSTSVIHLAGGTLVLKSTDGKVKSGVLHATYRLTGTGKYANARGSGTLTASLTDFVHVFKGKISF